MKTSALIRALLILSLIQAAHAEVRLHPLFSNGAVLQRDRAVPVWGWAGPGEKVSVSFADQTVGTSADASGQWLASLAPLPASAQPGELVVRGSNTLTVRDVLVGDVWVASGQSNMDAPMSSGSSASLLPAITDPLLRFYVVKKAISATPLAEPSGAWSSADPQSARIYSAVACCFAREIRRTQRVPVAVIQASWGGTPIRTWMSVESLRAAPPIASTVQEWEEALARHEAVKGTPELMTRYYAEMKDWETNVDQPFRAARTLHEKEAAAARAAGQPVPPAPKPARPEPTVPDPIAMPAASKRPSTPTITYNAMIAPLAPYALRGVLWYQGEADATRGAEYRRWFPRMIEGWRTAWRQPDLPFVFVQLPAFGRDDTPVANHGLPFTREAQAMALQLPHTAMAVTLDIGNPGDVHPDNKEHVGRRLALAARERVYAEDVLGSGPTYVRHSTEGKEIRIQFAHLGGGLVIGEAPWRVAGTPPPPADRLLGFFLCGADRKWAAADARIEGDSVVVTSPEVAAPVAVRYGWALSPQVNLANRAGLPAAPFRTDDWPSGDRP